jgi:hypothetical protein
MNDGSPDIFPVCDPVFAAELQSSWRTFADLSRFISLCRKTGQITALSSRALRITPCAMTIAQGATFHRRATPPTIR